MIDTLWMLVAFAGFHLGGCQTLSSDISIPVSPDVSPSIPSSSVYDVKTSITHTSAIQYTSSNLETIHSTTLNEVPSETRTYSETVISPSYVSTMGSSEELITSSLSSSPPGSYLNTSSTIIEHSTTAGMVYQSNLQTTANSQPTNVLVTITQSAVDTSTTSVSIPVTIPSETAEWQSITTYSLFSSSSVTDVPTDGSSSANASILFSSESTFESSYTSTHVILTGSQSSINSHSVPTDTMTDTSSIYPTKVSDFTQTSTSLSSISQIGTYLNTNIRSSSSSPSQSSFALTTSTSEMQSSQQSDTISSTYVMSAVLESSFMSQSVTSSVLTGTSTQILYTSDNNLLSSQSKDTSATQDIVESTNSIYTNVINTVVSTLIVAPSDTQLMSKSSSTTLLSNVDSYTQISYTTPFVVNSTTSIISDSIKLSSVSTSLSVADIVETVTTQTIVPSSTITDTSVASLPDSVIHTGSQFTSASSNLESETAKVTASTFDSEYLTASSLVYSTIPSTDGPSGSVSTTTVYLQPSISPSVSIQASISASDTGQYTTPEASVTITSTFINLSLPEYTSTPLMDNTRSTLTALTIKESPLTTFEAGTQILSSSIQSDFSTASHVLESQYSTIRISASSSITSLLEHSSTTESMLTLIKPSVHPSLRTSFQSEIPSSLRYSEYTLSQVDGTEPQLTAAIVNSTMSFDSSYLFSISVTPSSSASGIRATPSYSTPLSKPVNHSTTNYAISTTETSSDVMALETPLLSSIVSSSVLDISATSEYSAFSDLFSVTLDSSYEVTSSPSIIYELSSMSITTNSEGSKLLSYESNTLGISSELTYIETKVLTTTHLVTETDTRSISISVDIESTPTTYTRIAPTVTTPNTILLSSMQPSDTTKELYSFTTEILDSYSFIVSITPSTTDSEHIKQTSTIAPTSVESSIEPGNSSQYATSSEYISYGTSFTATFETKLSEQSTQQSYFTISGEVKSETSEITTTYTNPSISTNTSLISSFESDFYSSYTEQSVTLTNIFSASIKDTMLTYTTRLESSVEASGISASSESTSYKTDMLSNSLEDSAGEITSTSTISMTQLQRSTMSDTLLSGSLSSSSMVTPMYVFTYISTISESLSVSTSIGSLMSEDQTRSLSAVPTTGSITLNTLKTSVNISPTSTQYTSSEHSFPSTIYSIFSSVVLPETSDSKILSSTSSLQPSTSYLLVPSDLSTEYLSTMKTPYDSPSTQLATTFQQTDSTIMTAIEPSSIHTQSIGSSSGTLIAPTDVVTYSSVTYTAIAATPASGASVVTSGWQTPDTSSSYEPTLRSKSPLSSSHDFMSSHSHILSSVLFTSPLVLSSVLSATSVTFTSVPLITSTSLVTSNTSTSSLLFISESSVVPLSSFTLTNVLSRTPDSSVVPTDVPSSSVVLTGVSSSSSFSSGIVVPPASNSSLISRGTDSEFSLSPSSIASPFVSSSTYISFSTVQHDSAAFSPSSLLSHSLSNPMEETTLHTSSLSELFIESSSPAGFQSSISRSASTIQTYTSVTNSHIAVYYTSSILYASSHETSLEFTSILSRASEWSDLSDLLLSTTIATPLPTRSTYALTSDKTVQYVAFTSVSSALPVYSVPSPSVASSSIYSVTESSPSMSSVSLSDVPPVTATSSITPSILPSFPHEISLLSSSIAPTTRLTRLTSFPSIPYLTLTARQSSSYLSIFPNQSESPSSLSYSSRSGFSYNSSSSTLSISTHAPDSIASMVIRSTPVEFTTDMTGMHSRSPHAPDMVSSISFVLSSASTTDSYTMSPSIRPTSSTIVYSALQHSTQSNSVVSFFPSKRSSQFMNTLSGSNDLSLSSLVTLSPDSYATYASRTTEYSLSLSSLIDNQWLSSPLTSTYVPYVSSVISPVTTISFISRVSIPSVDHYSSISLSPRASTRTFVNPPSSHNILSVSVTSSSYVYYVVSSLFSVASSVNNDPSISSRYDILSSSEPMYFSTMYTQESVSSVTDKERHTSIMSSSFDNRVTTSTASYLSVSSSAAVPATKSIDVTSSSRTLSPAMSSASIVSFRSISQPDTTTVYSSEPFSASSLDIFTTSAVVAASASRTSATSIIIGASSFASTLSSYSTDRSSSQYMQNSDPSSSEYMQKSDIMNRTVTSDTLTQTLVTSVGGESTLKSSPVSDLSQILISSQLAMQTRSISSSLSPTPLSLASPTTITSSFSKFTELPITLSPTTTTSSVSKFTELPITLSPTTTTSSISEFSQMPKTLSPTTTTSSVTKFSELATTLLPTATTSSISMFSQIPKTLSPTTITSSFSKFSELATTLSPTTTTSYISKFTELPITLSPTTTTSSISKFSQLPITLSPTTTTSSVSRFSESSITLSSTMTTSSVSKFSELSITLSETIDSIVFSSMFSHEQFISSSTDSSFIYNMSTNTASTISAVTASSMTVGNSFQTFSSTLSAVTSYSMTVRNSLQMFSLSSSQKTVTHTSTKSSISITSIMIPAMTTTTSTPTYSTAVLVNTIFSAVPVYSSPVEITSASLLASASSVALIASATSVNPSTSLSTMATPTRSLFSGTTGNSTDSVYHVSTTGFLSTTPTNSLTSSIITTTINATSDVQTTTIAPTSVIMVTSSVMKPTTESPTETTVQASTAGEPYWVETKLKVQKATDVTSGAFREGLELRLAEAYNEAFIRQQLQAEGKFEPLQKRRRRRKRAVTVGQATVHVRQIIREPGTTIVTATYVVAKNGTVLPATTAVGSLDVMTTQELAIFLHHVVDSKAESFIKVDEPLDGDKDGAPLLLIAVVAGPIAGGLLIIWLLVCVYIKCCRHKKAYAAEEPELTGIKEQAEKEREPHTSGNSNPLFNSTDEIRPSKTKHSPTKKGRPYETNSPNESPKTRSKDADVTITPLTSPTKQNYRPQPPAPSPNGAPKETTPTTSPQHGYPTVKENSPEHDSRSSKKLTKSTSQRRNTLASSYGTDPTVDVIFPHNVAESQLLQPRITERDGELMERARQERRKNKERLRKKRQKEKAGESVEGTITYVRKPSDCVKPPEVFIDRYIHVSAGESVEGTITYVRKPSDCVKPPEVFIDRQYTDTMDERDFNNRDNDYNAVSQADTDAESVAEVFGIICMADPENEHTSIAGDNTYVIASLNTSMKSSNICEEDVPVVLMVPEVPITNNERTHVSVQEHEVHDKRSLNAGSAVFDEKTKKQYNYRKFSSTFIGDIKSCEDNAITSYPSFEFDRRQSGRDTTQYCSQSLDQTQMESILITDILEFKHDMEKATKCIEAKLQAQLDLPDIKGTVPDTYLSRTTTGGSKTSEKVMPAVSVMDTTNVSIASCRYETVSIQTDRDDDANVGPSMYCVQVPDIGAYIHMPRSYSGQSLTTTPKSGSPRKQIKPVRQDSGVSNEPLSGDETLEEARQRMHMLLDDAFTLISPRASFSEQGDRRGSAPFPRQHSPAITSSTVHISASNEPTTHTGKNTGREPMFPNPVFDSESYNDFPLETWSPYRSTDKMALISMPHLVDTKLGGKNANKPTTPKTARRPAATLDAPMSKSTGQMLESKYTDSPAKPIVLRTKELLNNQSEDVNQLNVRNNNKTTSGNRKYSVTGINGDINLTGSTTTLSQSRNKGVPNGNRTQNGGNVSTAARQQRGPAISVKAGDNVGFEPTEDILLSLRNDIEILKGQYGTGTNEKKKSKRNAARSMTDIV